MAQNRIEFCRILIALAIPCLLGCGRGDQPETGYVSGTVTLDGTPLPGAGISFEQQGFRASLGMTDADGHYELRYLRDIKGAVVGEHTIKIDRLPQEGAGRTRHLPPRYNRETQLTREVLPGSNTFDFNLTSEP